MSVLYFNKNQKERENGKNLDRCDIDSTLASSMSTHLPVCVFPVCLCRCNVEKHDRHGDFDRCGDEGKSD